MGRRATGGTRFNEANTTGALLDLERIQADPGLPRRLIADSTRQDRQRALESWNQFIRLRFQDKGPDYGDIIWVWLAGDVMRERKEAVAVCKLFLQHFVHTSSRQVIVWGPDETQSRRGLNCVTSLNTTWKTLVAAAQEQVLDPLAVTTGRQLTISREQGPRGAADIGVVTQITTWMGTTLKAQYNLTTDSEYSKVAATCKDIERLLLALWERADAVPMARENRITVHIYLLILYVSGCRPGMLKDIRWRDCQLYLLPDPLDPSRPRLFFDLTLRFNKLKLDSVLLGSDRKSFTFSLTLMPTPLLDVTHLVATWAVYKKALAYDFPSVAAMLKKPDLGSGKIMFQWKPELQDQRPWKMSCDTFRFHFKRLCLVAGLQSPPRPYFLRIGAGANFEDKGMPASLMCQILSHTEKVHNQKYQSLRTRHDVQGAAFGNLAGDSQQLFQYLGHAWKDFDTDAPVYMTKVQKVEIENRQDTTKLKQEINDLKEAGVSKAGLRPVEERLAQHKRRLEDLAILARREAYFTEKAKYSQLGTPPPKGKPEEEVRWRARHAELDLDRLMRAWVSGTIFDADAEARAIAATAWIGHYLARTDSEIRRPPVTAAYKQAVMHVPSTEGAAASNTILGSHGGHNLTADDLAAAEQLRIPAGKGAKCIICSKAFVRRVELTKHSAAVHSAALHQDMSCPVCFTVTSSPSQFSNHVEREHGKQYAPYFPTESAPTLMTTRVPLPTHVFCAACSHVSARAEDFLSKHFNQHHADDAGCLDRRLDCPQCIDVRGLDVDAWVDHLSAAHDVPRAERCPFCNRFFQLQGLAPHIRRSHFNTAGSSFPCPICAHQNGKAVLLSDFASWRVHALAAGHLSERPPQTPPGTGSLGKRSREAHDGPADPRQDPDALHKRLRRGSNGASSLSLQGRGCSPLDYSASAWENGAGPGRDTCNTALTSASLDSPRWDMAQLPSIDTPSRLSSPSSSGGPLPLDLNLVDPALWRCETHPCPPALMPHNPSTDLATEPSALIISDNMEEQQSPQSLAGSTVCATPSTVQDAPILDCIVVKPLRYLSSAKSSIVQKQPPAVASKHTSNTTSRAKRGSHKSRGGSVRRYLLRSRSP